MEIPGKQFHLSLISSAYGRVKTGETLAMPASPLSRAVKIFFSYAVSANVDKDLLDKLTNSLSVLKRQRLIEEWYDSGLSPGVHINQLTEAYFQVADIIVLLISPDFLASERCYEVEMQRALELSAAGKAQLIPVLLRPALWEDLPLHSYTPLPPGGVPVTLWQNLDDALSHVAHGIRHVIGEVVNQAKRIRPSAPERRLYQVPHRPYAFFTDREEVLARLSATFAGTPTQHPTILALNGLGGIGKTQIALEYIRQHAERYQSILWLNASARDILNAEVSSLVGRLSLFSANDDPDEDELFTAFKSWLQEQPNWLLVLDHLTDIALVSLLIPHIGTGHVLVTTRAQAIGGFAAPLPITNLELDASVLFLLHRARLLPLEAKLDQATPEMQAQARAITQELAGFPLALDQAGAYLEETGSSLADYLALYQRKRTQLLRQRGRMAEGHPESVSVTLSLAIAQVKAKQKTYLNLLHLLAFLQPDSIPIELIEYGAAKLEEPLQVLAADRLQLNEAIAELLHFSLVVRGADASTLTIHPLTQVILLDDLTPEEQRAWAEQAVSLVEQVFPEGDFTSWSEYERYLAQAQHSARLIQDYQLMHGGAAPLLQRLGAYAYERACYTDAEHYLTQALELYEQQPHPPALGFGRVLNSLGRLAYRQADYEQAETFHLRALALREQALGPNHPQTAESLHNLAALYLRLDQYQQAEQFYLRVVALDEKHGDPDYAEAAKTLNNLGLTYFMQGQYGQAETFYRRALALYENHLPPDHPDLAYTLNSLGVLSETLGDYTQAETLYRHALAIREEVLRKEHPDTAHSINKVAGIAETQGRYEEAEALYRRALAIAEQVWGPVHPDVALYLNNLALLADKQGDYTTAELLYQQALSIYEETIGKIQLVVAGVLSNLGQLYQNTKNRERAEPLLKRALAIRTQILGPTHPDTLKSQNILAQLSTQQNDADNDKHEKDDLR